MVPVVLPTFHFIEVYSIRLGDSVIMQLTITISLIFQVMLQLI